MGYSVQLPEANIVSRQEEDMRETMERVERDDYYENRGSGLEVGRKPA